MTDIKKKLNIGNPVKVDDVVDSSVKQKKVKGISDERIAELMSMPYAVRKTVKAHWVWAELTELIMQLERALEDGKISFMEGLMLGQTLIRIGAKLLGWFK